jgi:hypothetical protein
VTSKSYAFCNLLIYARNKWVYDLIIKNEATGTSSLLFFGSRLPVVSPEYLFCVLVVFVCADEGTPGPGTYAPFSTFSSKGSGFGSSARLSHTDDATPSPLDYVSAGHKYYHEGTSLQEQQ